MRNTLVGLFGDSKPNLRDLEGLAPPAHYEIRRELNTQGERVYALYKNDKWVATHSDLKVLEDGLKWILEQSIY